MDLRLSEDSEEGTPGVVSNNLGYNGLQRAQDVKGRRLRSTTTMAMDDPPIPVVPIAVRIFLVCKVRQVVIMRVRRMLSAIEIECQG